MAGRVVCRTSASRRPHMVSQCYRIPGVHVRDFEEFFDDVSGAQLEPHLVREARAEGLRQFANREACIKVPLEKCYSKTGKNPIGVRWVDHNKGDDLNPNVRSRLVAKQIKRPGDVDLFAAMPPLEAKKLLLSCLASQRRGGLRGRRLKLGLVDVRKAYLYAPATEDIYIELPEEDKAEGMCGKLRVSLYGTRSAAKNWEAEYARTLEGMGFVRGMSTPCAFYLPGTETRVVVHGDDLTVLGTEADIMRFKAGMEEKYDISFKGMLGPDPRDKKEMTLLNRVIRYSHRGLEWEADPRHCEQIARELGLTPGVTTALSTPSTRPTAEEIAASEPLPPEEATRYRALVARANYLSQDRADIQYTTKELSRCMSQPTCLDWARLKRLGRYLLGRPRVVCYFPFQEDVNVLTCDVDADWAGCLKTRRSTHGGCLKWGKHVLKHWSATQATVATSSGEAEFTGLVRGASAAMGLQALMKDLGMEATITLRSDSSAAMWHRGQDRTRQGPASGGASPVDPGSNPQGAGQSGQGRQKREPR